MSVADAAVYAIHLIFAATWAGSVVFVTVGLLPAAMNGDGDVDQLSFATGRIKLVSRASALLLLITGGHLAATFYGGGRLTGDPAGHLVLGMVVLWLALAGLVEVGASKLEAGLDEDKIRTPAADARPFFLAATVVSVLLFVDAGLILGL